ncbi:serine/threonine-protein kinase [Corallococcus macrosporus]|uniref:non-specific serine/threonine protein kinase n=1 Tax=Corallococcus macrosporus DSM 14697 TaxID=1189310 RepID=A0A250JPT0_9BACT|nr:serine/threonine-protein kinase [Corallococcus macrosporus]ATB45884.1 serine/threonine protein kinase [Corallococcus macrosporus DSM 14697]
MPEVSSGGGCAVCGRRHGTEASCPTLVRADVGGGGTARPRCAPTVEAQDPLVGTRCGSFRLTRRLGRGGMGSVYLGEHVSIGSRVAVKVLHAHLTMYPELVQRFHAEARAVNLIGHENIVSIFDMDAAPPRPYLIMELLDGSPLSAWVGTPLAAGAVVSVLSQVCDALQAAHARGIVHRDLKPDNIFLVRRKRSAPFVKVLDFGIAKLADAHMPQTHAGIIVGTPEYMAPEQSLGRGVDGRADLYALGVIAYQLLTGRLPFNDEGLTAQLVAHQLRPPPPPSSVYPAVSAALEHVILRALAKKPEDRYPSIAAFRDALQVALVEHQRVSARKTRPGGHPVLEQAPVASMARVQARLPSGSRAGPLPSLLAGAPLRRPPSAAPTASPRASNVEVPVQVVLRPGESPVRLRGSGLSRGGLFLHGGRFLPPLCARLPVVLELASGPLSVMCEVVRLVPPAQARVWGMPTGFGVQFVEATAVLKAAVDALLQGDPVREAPSAPSAEDPAVARLLEAWRQRSAGDAYAVLALDQDSDMVTVRLRTREAWRSLESLEQHPLTPPQRAQVDALRVRVREAAEALGATAHRALYDAWRGNHRGVAKCLEAGLTAEQLESLRREFLSRRPQAMGSARIHFQSGGALEREGRLSQALEQYERGLRLAPLEVDMLQRYRRLRRVLGGRPAVAGHDRARSP